MPELSRIRVGKIIKTNGNSTDLTQKLSKVGRRNVASELASTYNSIED